MILSLSPEAVMVNAGPYENPDAYCLEGLNRHFPNVGSGIPIKAPQLSGSFPKEDFYPRMET